MLRPTRWRGVPGSGESKGTFGKGFFDAVIIGSEVAIMFLNRCHSVTEPDGDFINTFSSGKQKTGEPVPHRVRRYPVAPLHSHVFHEGRPEIVAIKPLSMGHVGPEHEWRPHAIG